MKQICVGAALTACLILLRPTSVRAEDLHIDSRSSRVASLLRQPARAPAGFRLPGEFEPHGGLLIGCCYLSSDDVRVFADVVRVAVESIAVVILVSDTEELNAAWVALKNFGVTRGRDNVYFLPAPHDTMWARDYGPFVLVGPRRQVVVVDADYGAEGRDEDDQVPARLGDQLTLNVISSPLVIEGGNLLSNGEGLLVATTALLQRNLDEGWTEDAVREQLLALFGANQVVFIEPLAGEPTSHVDMFATFIDAQTMVVGDYSVEADPDNASILDRNATRLRQVKTARGNLSVVRIPMARHDDGVWRTFTNVVFANQVLLVPIYPDEDANASEQALSIFRQLLPEHRVVGIDAESIIQSGGALHCLTMHLGPIHRLPNLPIPVPRWESPDYTTSVAELPRVVDLPNSQTPPLQLDLTKRPTSTQDYQTMGCLVWKLNTKARPLERR